VPWGFDEQLKARPPLGFGWFSIGDMMNRSANAVSPHTFCRRRTGAPSTIAACTAAAVADRTPPSPCAQLGLFYYSLATQPISFVRFSYRYNKLWCAARPVMRCSLPTPARGILLPSSNSYPVRLSRGRRGGRLAGMGLTLLLPAQPFVFAVIEWASRLKKKLTAAKAEDDWRTAGPGRVWFIPPKSTLATLVYDFFCPLQNYVGAFVMFGDDQLGITHTWYDEVCTKEFWCAKVSG